jgi:hypothetical protein
MVHNMHRLILLPEFTEDDVYWLNTQAKIFVKDGNNSALAVYEPITSRIEELFSLVPDSLTEKLTWEGPKRFMTK